MSIIAPSAPTRRRVRRRSTQEERTPGRPRRGNIKTWETKGGDVGYGVLRRPGGRAPLRACGLASEGWTEERAYAALEQYLEEVRLGIFRPTEDLPPITHSDPLFDDFAREFLTEHAVEIKPRTREFYEATWRNHLSPAFGHPRLSQITYDVIRRYKLDQLRLIDQVERAAERGVKVLTSDGRPVKLSPRTINHRCDSTAACRRCRRDSPRTSSGGRTSR